MIHCDVLQFGDFVTKSGRKTPYFINTGNYKTGAQVSKLGSFYAGMIQDAGCGYDAMFGPAYKGIPLVTSCACALNRWYGVDKPFFFNRKEEKDHSEDGALIGYTPQDGDCIIIIEDVVTEGAALREVLPLIHQSAETSCRDMFVSVDRCEVGQTPGKTAIMEIKEEFGITVHSLITAADIRDYLRQTGTRDALLTRMEQYMEQYCAIS